MMTGNYTKGIGADSIYADISTQSCFDARTFFSVFLMRYSTVAPTMGSSHVECSSLAKRLKVEISSGVQRKGVFAVGVIT